MQAASVAIDVDGAPREGVLVNEFLCSGRVLLDTFRLHPMQGFRLVARKEAETPFRVDVAGVPVVVDGRYGCAYLQDADRTLVLFSSQEWAWVDTVRATTRMGPTVACVDRYLRERGGKVIHSLGFDYLVPADSPEEGTVVAHAEKRVPKVAIAPIAKRRRRRPRPVTEKEFMGVFTTPMLCLLQRFTDDDAHNLSVLKQRGACGYRFVSQRKDATGQTYFFVYLDWRGTRRNPRSSTHMYCSVRFATAEAAALEAIRFMRTSTAQHGQTCQM